MRAKVLALAARLDAMSGAAEEEASAATYSDEHISAVTEANAFRFAARCIREAAAEDAAELERLRATVARVERLAGRCEEAEIHAVGHGDMASADKWGCFAADLRAALDDEAAS